MSTITKERIANLLQFNSEGSDCQANAEQWEVHELARIALASLEAEPVLYAAEETLAYSKLGELHLTCLSEPMGDAVIPLYTAPPAPVSDSLLSELLGIAKRTAAEADECAHAEFSDDSMKHSAAIADWERRATRLQGAGGVLTNEDTKRVGELVMWVKRLAHSLRKANPDSKLQSDAMDYLSRNGLIGAKDILR
ncbi:TPA: hypothetical protein ACOEHL_002254 [Enterobacter hormaechei subsp. xiangfangensis]